MILFDPPAPCTVSPVFLGAGPSEVNRGLEGFPRRAHHTWAHCAWSSQKARVSGVKRTSKSHCKHTKMVATGGGGTIYFGDVGTLQILLASHGRTNREGRRLPSLNIFRRQTPKSLRTWSGSGTGEIPHSDGPLSRTSKGNGLVWNPAHCRIVDLSTLSRRRAILRKG